MNKITVYYSVLIVVIVVQFVSSVISKSIAVQQSAVLVTQQKQLASLEQREANLINTIATQTALSTPTAEAEGYVAITRPVTVIPTSLVAAR